MCKDKKSKNIDKRNDETRKHPSVGRDPRINFAFTKTRKPPQKPTGKGDDDDN